MDCNDAWWLWFWSYHLDNKILEKLLVYNVLLVQLTLRLGGLQEFVKRRVWSDIPGVSWSFVPVSVDYWKLTRSSAYPFRNVSSLTLVDNNRLNSSSACIIHAIVDHSWNAWTPQFFSTDSMQLMVNILFNFCK
jgi:hypothetical protein